jgi:hypothetical protein
VTLFIMLATLTIAAVITDAANRIVTAADDGTVADLPVKVLERLALYREIHGGVVGLGGGD